MLITTSINKYSKLPMETKTQRKRVLGKTKLLPRHEKKEILGEQLKHLIKYGKKSQRFTGST